MLHLDIKRKISIMIAVMAAMLFASLNQTIIGTALPRIVADLGGMEYFNWVFTIYMLTSTVTAILVGKLSDIYGRKIFILIGIIIFIIGTFLCGLSQTIIDLIIYRGIQGLGAGIIMSTSFTVIGDLFSPRERGRWQGLMSAVFGVSSVFGPTLGGYIVDHAEWHWIFWVFLPVGVVALIMIWVMFPATERKQGESIDYFGSIFLTTSIVPLLLAFSWAGTHFAWNSPQIISLFTAAALSIGLFILAELKAKNPALPLNLFKNSVFTVSNLVGFTMGAGMFGTIMYAPFFIQGVMGASPLVSGYIIMPLTLSLVISSAVTGMLITKTGKYKRLALGGLLVMAIGLFLMTTMNMHTTNLTAIIFLTIVGSGLGVGMPVFTLTIQNAVADRLLGVATASAQLFRQLGGTIGVAVMGTIMSNRMISKLSELTAAEQGSSASPLTPELAGTLQEMSDPKVLMDPAQLEAIRLKLPAELQDLFTSMVHMLRESLSFSLTGVFFFGGIAIVVAFLITFLLKELPLRTSAHKDDQPNQAGNAKVQINEN